MIKIGQLTPENPDAANKVLGRAANLCPLGELSSSVSHPGRLAALLRRKPPI